MKVATITHGTGGVRITIDGFVHQYANANGNARNRPFASCSTKWIRRPPPRL